MTCKPDALLVLHYIEDKAKEILEEVIQRGDTTGTYIGAVHDLVGAAAVNTPAADTRFMHHYNTTAMVLTRDLLWARIFQLLELPELTGD